MAQKTLTLEEIANPALSSKNAPILADLLGRGETFQTIFKISQEDMEARYGEACHLLERERWDDAVPAFTFLVCLQPYDARFWFGLGAAQTNVADYIGAISTYTIAASMAPENPYSYFHMASSFLALSQKEDAVGCLEMARDTARKDHTFRHLEDKCDALLKKLKHK